MPLHFIKSRNTYTLAIYDAKENIDELIESSLLHGEELDRILALKQHRQREMLGTQTLINLVRAQYSPFKKDDYRKPFLTDNPDLNFSLSHSGSFSGILLSHLKSGIDIQIHNAVVKRIAPKFLYKTEIDELGKSALEKLHFYWGIKEAVFKAWGKGGVAFREMIAVKPFEIVDSKIATSVTFQKDDNILKFKARGMILDNLFVSYVIEDV